MNRQLIIRGAAVSTAAIAASVFAAGQFLGDQTAMTPSGAVSGEGSAVRGASLMGSASFPLPAAERLPDGSSAPSLQVSALDASPETAAAPDLQSDIQPKLVLAEPEPRQEAPLCATEMTASPAIDGLFEVRLSAPCNAGERVVVSHGDLAFSATLDKAGVFSAYLPALSGSVTVEAFMAEDTMVQASTDVPDFDQYARMIVQWSGADVMALHAFHRGAAYGEAGHIHAMNPFDPKLEEAFLVSLGDPNTMEPMLAQVYSVPVGQAADTRVQLEFGTSAATCGTDVSAFILSKTGDQPSRPDELQVAMPECGTNDGFVLVDLPFAAEAHTGQGLKFTADQS